MRRASPREQGQASLPVMLERIDAMGVTYDELMFQICGQAA